MKRKVVFYCGKRGSENVTAYTKKYRYLISKSKLKLENYNK